ncbi:phage tail spike protein [Streptococcus oralis]|uniref:phage tail spike protein n=1 Tax=Streptococcus oralis TaxID=1303 RepID=UPI0020008702|nr:phage tail spike protein [Streptococcus oralis]
MIYLTNGNMPLNAAYADEIVQEDNSTYQLTFRFPTSDSLWEKLKEETFLIADDLHGEQDFVIFEVEKKHGYIQVYANQVMTLLNNYVVNPISLDRETGSTALSRFAGSITRDNPFSFFSDIEDRHTFNIDSKNAMDAFAKDKHSILGLWGGDLVRHGYQVRLLKNGGLENESLFMYQKNLSNYEHKTSTKSLRTRITFITTIRGEGEKPVDKHYKVVVDSPLINKYSQIYEDVIEVNDEDVVDEATLLKYGKQYFRTTLCDMLEDSIEIDVIGQSDVPVQMYDVVGVYHEYYDLDVRKKISKYNYSPMAKKLKSIGFGDFKSGLANAIGNAVSDAVKDETQKLQGQFETQLARETKNADLAFDRQKEELVNQFTDGLNAAKARAEEVKQELSNTIDQRFSSFDNASIQEAKRKAEEALQKVGANTLLAQEAKQIGEQLRRQLDNKADLVEFQRVKETNQIYERIIGSSESDITEKVARMVLTNQLFQVEVGKYANAGGPNMLRNSRADDGLKHWTEANGRLGFTSHGYYFNGQKRMFELRPGAVVKSPRFIIKRNTDYTLNILGFDNNSKYFRVYISKRVKGSNSDFQERLLIFNGQPKRVDGPVFDNTKAIKKSITFNVGEYDECYLQFEFDRNNPNKWGGLFMTELDFYEGTTDRLWQPAPEDATLETDKALEATQTKMTLLQSSFAFQNLTSAGSIVSQINATNNQILIEAEKIRLKGKTLADQFTAIDGYFKRLFAGEGNFAKLNAEIIGANTITADKLVMDQAMARRFVSSDIFTDTLAAKEAFINKLRSVVVSATLLEGYKGVIGGFQLGTHEKDPTVYWLTGRDQFSVGMSNGYGKWSQTALWVNWGNDWNAPGNYAWFVKRSGEMYCYNRAYFWNTPVIYGDLRVTGNIYYHNENSGKSGYWIHSSKYSNFEPSNNYLYLYYSGSGYDWIPMNKEISDRRYKHNIEASAVSGLDVIKNLKTYSYRKEYDGKIEDIACGIMAQDVQKYVPEAFYKNPDGAYSYRTFELVPYLIKAIQELNHKIEKLEKTA